MLKQSVQKPIKSLTKNTRTNQVQDQLKLTWLSMQKLTNMSDNK